MPIAFARLEFVSRSEGKNACAKAAYNSRSRIEFEGNALSVRKIYDWSYKKPPVFHEILLPKHVDEKFSSTAVLWNAAEQKEVRRNSQIAVEVVLALPDDKQISVDDRIFLSRTFVLEHFVSKGLAAQIDIHPPDEKAAFSEETGEKETTDHNWHAHVLVTTRRFKENGKEFEDHKARDVMPVMRGGRVISGANWGKLWAQHQNDFFAQKGLSLRVDSEGIVPQKHIGPQRFRGRAFSLMHENDMLLVLNSEECENSSKVLEKIVEMRSIFTPQDVDQFLHKHVNPSTVDEVKDAFWRQSEIVELMDPVSRKSLNRFSTQRIVAEEKQVLRLADRLMKKGAFKVTPQEMEKFSSPLNKEQKMAFSGIVSGKGLSCIEGYAGTGKSYLLAALKDVYESRGYTVRGLGPDNSTAEILQKKGFEKSENVYRFLFALHHRQREGDKHREVWILDEAGKLGTTPLLELLRFANKCGAQVVLSGDSSQLPSVGRGGMFRVFTERYGAQSLENIQRQKEERQREIARKLASGKMGHALDAIVSQGDIQWCSSKEKACETLIRAWAFQRSVSPNESNLIIAHSNREVRVLNELARLYRREAGELEEKEFLCESAFGKIYISCGDRVEFRKNDNDLKVTNGMTGVLVKASEKSFTVQMEGRKVTFDPRRYRSFQLGYASTYYRSQGRTIDRAYVLHSPMMNKEMFYVGLTRHVKSAELYVSEQDAKNLSRLKAQAFKTGAKFTTLDYLTQRELEKQQEENKSSQEIEELKAESSLLSKMQGYGREIWRGVHGNTHRAMQRFKDLNPSKDFFSPKLGESGIARGKVEEIKEEESNNEQQHFDSQELSKDFCRILEIEKERKDRPNKQSKIDRGEHWGNMSEEKRSILRKYFGGVDRASSLHSIVEAERELGGKRSSHFLGWQKACGERNALAHEVTRLCKQGDLRNIFESKNLEILHERSRRHEALQNCKSESAQIWEEKLRGNLEALLYRLYPEGPSRRDSKRLRFGSQGSLAVTCWGPNAGRFFDFEQQEGGGPLHLIQKVHACSRTDAIKWAKDFLDQAPSTVVPSQFIFKKREQDYEWISQKPDSAIPAPRFEEVAKGLSKTYQETVRYTYRDEEGREIFHVLRLENKQETGKKIVLPLSYGYCQGSEGDPKWSLKGYQAENRTLYNLHLLKQYPAAKVLVVKGEKTADAASEMFPRKDMVCLTWSGGAGAVGKSDWIPLQGRDVILWPDNDKTGYDASDATCIELRKAGIKSLRVVSKDILAQKLPPKWDLADSLPENLDDKFVANCLLRAEEKAVGLGKILDHLHTHNIPCVNHLHANEVLWRVEERLRPQLEAKHGEKHWEICTEILEEVSRILIDKDLSKEMAFFYASLGENAKDIKTAELELFQEKASDVKGLKALEKLPEIRPETMGRENCDEHELA